METFINGDGKLNKISTITLSVLLASSMNTLVHAEFYKKSISVGWLHIMPQSKYNTTHISTAVDPQQNYEVMPGLVANNPTYGGKISGITNWTDRAGLMPKNADTLGLISDFYLNDNVSIQFFGGIPPKVDVKGKGEIVAKVDSPDTLLHTMIAGPTGVAPGGIFITDLGQAAKIAEVRAWTPGVTAQYHFGKSGVNKFRPFVGAGMMYSHFSHLKIDDGLKEDLITAGHRIGYITHQFDNTPGHDDNTPGYTGDLLGSVADIYPERSPVSPKVKVKTTDTIGGILTLGSNYDLTKRIFATGSLTYVHKSNEAKISIIDETSGRTLVKSKTKIDLNPLISYVGLGYRF